MIDTALDNLPGAIRSKSGSVFYSGREAFTGKKSLYLLGLNPGGDPVAQVENTVDRHIVEHRRRQDRWSAYANDSWEGARPGTWGMQPRVLHMLREVGIDSQLTPASNVVFARTPNEAALRESKIAMLKACWPVHTRCPGRQRCYPQSMFGRQRIGFLHQAMPQFPRFQA